MQDPPRIRAEKTATATAAPAGRTFRGTLCGLLCSDCQEWVSDATLRLYRARKGDVTTQAVADPKWTFTPLKPEEVRAKEGDLLAEATTDAQGRFQVRLDDRYAGEAFQVDLLLKTVPHRKAGGPAPQPRQFSVTTLQPLWRQTDRGLVAVWDYCIPYRIWCGIRALFGAWTICGHVTVCRSKDPVAGVRVRAFDTDWLQDDELGSALTDGSGHFRIDYLTKDFQPGTFLNIELVGGPDLYFRVETPDGATVLLAEPSSKGRTPGRENSGPCVCVDLCLEEAPPRRPMPGPEPLFTKVGAYRVEPTFRDFAPDGTTAAGGLAFTGTIPLIGILPDGGAGDDLQYRFRVAKMAPSAEPAQDVVGPLVKPTVIGALEYYWWTGATWKMGAADYWVNRPGATVSIAQHGAPPLVVPVNKDVGPGGWIEAPRENDLFPGNGHGGIFKALGGLANLDTTALTSEAFDLTAPAPSRPTGLKAGDSVPPAQLSEKPTFRILFEARKLPSLAPAGATQLDTIALSNTSYTYRRHPEWAGSTPTARAVVSLDIAELTGPGATGCDKLEDHLHALFTACHPYLGAVQVSFEGNPPLPAPLSPAVAGGQAASGPAGYDFDISALPPCAYILWLSATVRLTSGYGLIGDATISDHIAFCKSA